jgi:hypothetical protein
MVIIVRIDLDRYDLPQIEAFVRDGIITLSEARESQAVRSLGDLKELLWVRRMQGEVRVAS